MAVVLPAPSGPDEAVELAARDLEGEPVERGDRAEAAHEAARGQGGAGIVRRPHRHRSVPGSVTWTGIPARSLPSRFWTTTSTG